jgi:hypothetical protein
MAHVFIRQHYFEHGLSVNPDFGQQMHLDALLHVSRSLEMLSLKRADSRGNLDTIVLSERHGEL